MAMARASSAAAMVMTKMMSTCPNARWPSVKSPNAAKPIRVHVDGVEHQLDGHEDEHGAAAREDAVDADGEERGGYDLKMGELYQVSSSCAVRS